MASEAGRGEVSGECYEGFRIVKRLGLSRSLGYIVRIWLSMSPLAIEMFRAI